MSTKDTKNTNDQLSNKERKELKEDLKHFGYLLPTNDEELEEFEKVYGTTQVMFPEHLNDTDFLFSDSYEKVSKIALQTTDKNTQDEQVASKKQAPIKQLENHYFKRLVLAAEIAFQLHQEATFGHVKFVKIQYLCEHSFQMKINSHYEKYAAGPLDPKHTHSIDSEFKKRKWFKVFRSEYGFRYEPDKNVNEYKQYYQNYFNNQIEQINYLVSLFRKQKSPFCEIVATLFSVWKESVDKGISPTNSFLIENFYKWGEEKKKYNEARLLQAIEWMKMNKVVPL